MFTLKNFRTKSPHFAYARLCIQKRGKKRKHQEKYKVRGIRVRSEPHELAKDYFDQHYSSYFGQDWPSIRCALQSRKKYCTVLNNFIETNEYEEMLLETGAYNFVSKMNQNALQKCEELSSKAQELQDTLKQKELLIDTSQVQSQTQEDEISADLKPLVDEIDEIEDEIDFYEEMSETGKRIRAYIYPKEDLGEFEPSIKTLEGFQFHQNFILDAASIVPVLALDPQPGDRILDMRSTPGAKLNVILQNILDDADVVAADTVTQRLTNLKHLLGRIIPANNRIYEGITLQKEDRTQWGDIDDCFNKVIIDAPCIDDRASMYEPENMSQHMFSHLRQKERAQLPELQSSLLKSAVMSCAVNGTIVYCTKTASRWQNEFVVQYTVQELLENHNILCEVVDLKLMTELLQDELYFYSAPPLGELIYPRLDANFGPVFICKLHRIT